MAWLSNAQIVLTAVTTAVASFVGFQQYQLEAQIGKLQAEVAERAEDRLEREQQRRFDFDVFGVVLGSLKEDDPELQRALVAYFETLEGSAFGTSMLVLFRSRSTDPIAAKEAGEALGREVETANVQIAQGVPAVVPSGDVVKPELEPSEGGLPFGTVYGGNKSGWDYDLFVCDSSLAKDPSATSSDVATILGTLEAFDLARGRVRLRPLADSEQKPMGSGLFMIVDPVEAEELKATELVRELGDAGLNFEKRPNSTAPSPWYISLFVCPD